MLDSLKKIYSIFPAGDKAKLFVLFWMMFVAALLEVVGIGLVPLFIMAVQDPDKVLSFPVIGDGLQYLQVTNTESMVLWGAVALIVTYVVKNGYLAFFYFIKKKFVANRGVYLQDRLFRAYMAAPYSFYIGRNSSELLRNVAGEVRRIVDQVLLPVIELVMNLIMFVCIMVLLLVWETSISLITMGVLGGVGFLFLRLTERKTSEYGMEDKELRTLLNKSVLQGLGGFKDARMLGRESLFLDEYKRNANRSKVANIYLYVVKQLPKPIIETLAIFSILMIALIMQLNGREISDITVVLGLFAAAAVKIMPTFNTSFGNISTIRYNIHSVDTVYDDIVLLEQEGAYPLDDIYSDPEKVPLRSQVQLDGVSYSYPESSEHALRKASLTINKGEAIALVGVSGAGKTTLVDLILGLLTPQSGLITVDGFDIRKNLRGWQKNIGYVPQNIYLLDDMIRRNIAYGIPDKQIDRDKLDAAIEAAQLRELIDRLPEGEQTIVGERGVRLSGGQRQRIGIARALYNNPQLLVLDEATSALDNLTEKYVIDAIEKLKGDRTIIMIAHRLTTVINCDRLYLMEEGEIVEEGTYSELIQQNEKFRQMALEP